MLHFDAMVRQFHARYAGAATRVFGTGRTPGGAASYDLLVREVVGADVLDLGCGDGSLLARMPTGLRLTGVDMSPEELAAARDRDLPATFIEARAQALPLADAWRLERDLASQFRPDSLGFVQE